MGAAEQLPLPTYVDHVTENAVRRDLQRPDVYQEFLRLALSAKASGRVFGAKALAERIRWSRVVERGDRDFVINNSDVSVWARWAVRDAPSLCGYFRTRTRTAR